MREIIADIDAFARAMDERRREEIRVFVDHSNILLGAQFRRLADETTDRQLSARINVQRLVSVVEGARWVNTDGPDNLRYVLGSMPHHFQTEPPTFKHWRDAGVIGLVRLGLVQPANFGRQTHNNSVSRSFSPKMAFNLR